MQAELIVVSYDRLDSLEATLESARRLYPDLPICVGLQGPGAGSEAATRLERSFQLRMVRSDTPSVTQSLNRCIMTSPAEIALMLDDDVMLCPGWLEAHCRAFEADADLAYSCGREIRLNGGRSVMSELARIPVELVHRLFLSRNMVLQGRIIGWMTWFGLLFGNFDRPGSCMINAPRGCNMAVRVPVFRESGGFSTGFRGNAWGFEPEFGIRLARQGRLGRYVGDAVALHAELAEGGTRKQQGRAWFQDFWHNHRTLMRTLGRQGWIGAAPRLLARFLKVQGGAASGSS